MKRSMFIALFLSAQILFVILQIHKHSYIAKLAYHKQKLETDRTTLAKKKQSLTNEWYTLTDQAAVKEVAEKELQLRPLSLSQVKKIKV